VADEVNINVGDDAIVDEETGGEETGDEETTPDNEGATWTQALEMQRTGLELLRSALQSQERLSSELLTENRNLREAVLTIPQTVTTEIRTALAETQSSILLALTPPAIQMPHSDTSLTEENANVVVTAPEATEQVSPATAVPERRKAVRTL
jgi:hypothetical protein